MEVVNNKIFEKIVNSSDGNSHYIKYSNGLIIQWGKKTGITDYGAINYPVSFTTTPAIFTQVIEGDYNNVILNVKVHSTSDETHFDYSEKYIGGGNTAVIRNATEEFYWYAIGF